MFKILQKEMQTLRSMVIIYGH